ncbi:uncharacterized protein LOC127258021 [Andrographis paniculata]|uniref:uncharacterized protein LOC127258021 n=1 Tax=Andrographis paniculata TaxID=175694 RepID=UPI0021E81C71|nr:uncharacterized protein LOC127258021 [Andrographis paniculata]
MEGGDRTFRVNFGSEGVARLRERINEKLKEYMGDYTDETLVEYVIVLLKNGRCKDEAKSELDVFLGDDSESFVSWLWDHLESSLNLYVQQPELHLEGALKTSAAEEQNGRTESHKIESVVEIGSKSSDKQKKQEKKGSVKVGSDSENPIPQNTVAGNADVKDETHHRLGRAKRLSSQVSIEKKRRRHDEHRPVKSEISQTTVSAPRRLLQFAVRDAVATSLSSSTASEPSRKRLRSVVSTSTGDSFHGERPQRIRTEPGSRSAMSVAIKAVADAVKDVNKVRPSRSVFDRLGRDNNLRNTNQIKEQSGVIEDEGDGYFAGEEEDIHFAYQRRNGNSLQQDVNMTDFNDDTTMPSDLGYGDGYNVDVIGHKNAHAYEVPSSAGDWVESEMPQYRLGKHASVPSTSRKLVSSINVDAPKSQYKEVRKVSESDGYNMIPGAGTMPRKPQALLTKEKTDLRHALLKNLKPDVGLQYESQKTESPAGLYSTGQPTEDAETRTIFVSNVHFAATKDSLLRHFNKFGEVLKVIIMTDPSTGQPKGSAYIEFMRKEASEQALSLDGTSFMSRLLKVVRKSSAQPETTSAVMWPRVARASPYAAAPRLGRVPFGRGFPSPYRSRMPTKPGPRSFQWKRDTQPVATDAPSQTSNSIAPPPPTRSLTYIRTEAKTEEVKINETSGTA